MDMMKGKLILTKLTQALLFTAGLSGLCSGLAMAASNISSVRLDISPRSDQTLMPGDVISGLQPEPMDETYFVYDYQVGSGNNIPGQSYTYTVEVRPKDDNLFSDNCAAEIKGAYEVALESRSQTQMRIRIKTFPFYVLENPRNFKSSGDDWTWSKVDYANAYDVIIFYDDAEGNEQTANRSVTGRKIDVSSYNKNERTFQKIEVRAKNNSSRADNFIAMSQYVDMDGVVDEEKSESSYSFRIPTARSNSVVTSTAVQQIGTQKSDSASTGTQASGPAASKANDPDYGAEPETEADPGTETSTSKEDSKMVGPGNTAFEGIEKIDPDKNPATKKNYNKGEWKSDDAGKWYFEEGGSQKKGWINPAGNEWYYLSKEDGVMQTGWQLIDRYWHYFDNSGKMLMGEQLIDGKWYYFNSVYGNGMPYGAMYANGTTPNGWYVGTDGAKVSG